jgi:hypothetical protein
MAQINGSTQYLSSHFAYYITWTETDVNVANNTSLVSAWVYVQKIGSYNVESSQNNHYLYIDGTAFNANNYVDMNPETTPRLLVSGSKTITHNADGSKSISISSSGEVCHIDPRPSYTPYTGSASATVALTTIPRAATITSAGNHTIGGNYSFSLSNPGDLYIKGRIYVWDGSTWDVVSTQNLGTPQSTATMTLGTTENNIMYAAMPNDTSRSMIMRIYTYSDSGYSNQVGNYYDANKTVYINQTINKPTFTTYTLENVDKTINNTDKYSNVLVSSSTATLLGTNLDKMIKGYSNIRAVITTANKMVALNYATEVKYRFTAGAKYDEENYSSSATVNLDITSADTGSVSVTAYDSRSLTTTVNDSFGTITDYSACNLWGLSLVRDNGVDSGTKLQISGSYWYGYFGGGTSGVQNTITAHYRYKETTESWGSQTWNSITLTDSSGSLSYDDYIDGDLGATGFDTSKAYNIEVRIYDKLTNKIVEATLDTGVPVMDITSDGIAVKKKYDATEGDSFQVDGYSIWEIIYPVGSLYISTTNSSPSDLFGFGTWERYGAGRMLVSWNSSDTDFDSVNELGGSKTHNHNEGVLRAAIGSPTGDADRLGFVSTVASDPSGGGTSNYTYAVPGTTSGHLSSGSFSHYTSAYGYTSTDSNMPPYITVYMWRRTA